MSEISEKYRKYLIEIKYDEQQYYTVSGADMTIKNEEERLLTDGNKMVLFEKIIFIKQATELFLFDKERLTAWAAEIPVDIEPYAQFDFDSFISDEIDFSNVAVLEDLYMSIGVIEDYAIQVMDSALLGYLESDVMKEFKSISADLFLWKVRDDFNHDFDFNTFLFNLLSIHDLLKDRITIYK